MTNIIIEFNNKKYNNTYKNTYKKTYKNNNNDNNIYCNKITINDLIKNTVNKNEYKDFKNNINNYFVIYNGSLVLPSLQIDINDDNNNCNNNCNKHCYITCIRKIKGGGIFAPLDPIIEPILAIGAVFESIGSFFVWLGKFIWWLIQFIGWIFMELLNPLNLADDFLQSLIIIIIAIIRIPFDLLLSLFALAANTMGNFMQGFWGWDQSSLTKNDKESKYFKKFDKNKNTKYYLTNSNTVPFSIILGTILCPPMGVFMDLGITGWLNILICCLLTIAFYVPGLVYALLIIYS